MLCRANFLHAGQVAMYTPTIFHISCMTKTDNIHEQWLLANIPTYIEFTICISNLFLKVQLLIVGLSYLISCNYKTAQSRSYVLDFLNTSVFFS